MADTNVVLMGFRGVIFVFMYLYFYWTVYFRPIIGAEDELPK